MTPRLRLLLGLPSCLIWLWGVGWGCLPVTSPQSSDGFERSEHLKLDSGIEDVIDKQESPPEQHIVRASVGSACKSHSNCIEELQCETQVPQGYCTKTCQKSIDCPAKSACARIRFSNGKEYLRCIATCKRDEDCRRGFFCFHPKNAWKQICYPRRK